MCKIKTDFIKSIFLFLNDFLFPEKSANVNSAYFCFWTFDIKLINKNLNFFKLNLFKIILNKQIDKYANTRNINSH